MRSYLAAALLAMVVSVLLTPLARRLALRLGALSDASGRHVSGRRVPRLGGIAIALAVLAPVVVLLQIDSGVARHVQRDQALAIGLLVGGAFMCLVGAVDDVRGLRATYKLVAQVLVAVLAYAVGFRIEVIALPGLGTLSMGAFALPVTVLWIVGITNAVNLIDGLDGLAAGVVFFAAVTNFAVSGIAGHVFVAVLMAAMMGALVGFLFFNFNPARIFMGDSGSYFLGYVLATTSLAGSKASTTVSLLVPVVALGVPIFDTLFSMVRRVLERRPIFSPDRGHIHHRLLDMGLTHRRAVMIIYGVCVALTAAAIAISLGKRWEVGAAMLGAAVVMIGLIRFVGYFEILQLRRGRERGPSDERVQALRRLVPHVSDRFASVSNEEELFAKLARIASEAKLTSCDVQAIGAAEPVFSWTEPEAGTRDLIWVDYPLGPDHRARATVRFGFLAHAVSPQVDILLQCVADTVAETLVRIDSKLTPEPAPAGTSEAGQSSEGVAVAS